MPFCRCVVCIYQMTFVGFRDLAGFGTKAIIFGCLPFHLSGSPSLTMWVRVEREVGLPESPFDADQHQIKGPGIRVDILGEWLQRP